MKPGYLYVLAHPSSPNLVKVGQTTLKPEERLAQHNSNYNEYAGRIVKESGQKWELKEYIAVPDPAYAESVFWKATPLADIPFRGGVEVEKMEWAWVQAGLDAAKKAGLRPSSKPVPDWVYAYTVWMRKRLEGRGIVLIGQVKSMVSGRASFRCDNGHEWRTRCLGVADGEGCPECGIGKRTTEEVWQSAKLGYIHLLIHPDKQGVIKITLESNDELNGWREHRFRFVEDPIFAETLIWKLLGQPKPHDGVINIDLKVAEQAFRSLIYEMFREIALEEKNQIFSSSKDLMTTGASQE